jgi:hypothetical protein
MESNSERERPDGRLPQRQPKWRGTENKPKNHQKRVTRDPQLDRDRKARGDRTLAMEGERQEIRGGGGAKVPRRSEGATGTTTEPSARAPKLTPAPTPANRVPPRTPILGRRQPQRLFPPPTIPPQALALHTNAPKSSDEPGGTRWKPRCGWCL